MKKQNTNYRRLFLALWPDPEVRRQISACQQHLKFDNAPGRCALPVTADNLHLTLRFLGAVAENQVPALCARLAEVGQVEFELSLQSFGFFVAPRIVWLGLETPSSALLQLVNSLNTAVAKAVPEAAGGDDDRFIAHISLCKNAAVLPEATSCPVIHWRVTEFALVESITTDQGVVYRVLQSWPLISPAP